MSAPAAGALLEVEDLRVAFATSDGVVQAADGVSFSVARGQTLAIVGESGSGKTVTALTTAGLTRGPRTQISGRVMFDGEELLGLPGERMRRLRGDAIGIVFQDPLAALHPLFRIGRQIAEGIRAHRDVSRAAARARVLELLGLVGIPDPARRIDAYPHELSGGMRQRVTIAMALANEPRLLIADEPTTALDVTVQRQILELIERLRRELDMAVVLITHDLGVVAETADEVAVMYAGRIVERAPAAQLFAAPRHPYTWGLLTSIPRLDAPRGSELTAIPGRPPSLAHPPSGCRFHPRCPYVQPEHRRVDPPLALVPGDAGHEAACLLPAEVRSGLWQRLSAGATPVEARAAVGIVSEPIATTAGDVAARAAKATGEPAE